MERMGDSVVAFGDGEKDSEDEYEDPSRDKGGEEV